MPTDHKVQQGEYLSQIAEKYGFFHYKTIWDHPDNAQLKKLRQSPNVLLPGDTVKIPDKAEKKESRPTGQLSYFKVPRERLFLHLALKDFDDQPLADTKCELQIAGKSTPLTTDGKGHIKVPIPRTATEATLVFKDPLVPFDLSVPIKIGHLDPVDEISGQKARLSNLGYITRPLEEVDETVFSRSVQEFQCDLGLPVTGECDDATQGKLKDLHGS
jgi:Putative peptidoglycan binding domain